VLCFIVRARAGRILISDEVELAIAWAALWEPHLSLRARSSNHRERSSRAINSIHLFPIASISTRERGIRCQKERQKHQQKTDPSRHKKHKTSIHIHTRACADLKRATV
jgi:hypothetical protein